MSGTPVRDHRGFTLLETVVALAIVGTVSVAALAALGTELRTAERANRALEASALLSDRLAALQLLSAPDLRALPDSLRQGRFAPPFAGFGWRASSEPVRGEPGLFDVAVTVVWDAGVQGLATRVYRGGEEPPR